MLRAVFSFLIALALIHAPPAMAMGAPHVAPTVEASSSDQGHQHCSGQQDTDSERTAAKASCATSCAALPLGPGATTFIPARSPVALQEPPAQLLIGIHPERETPPPRRLRGTLTY